MSQFTKQFAIIEKLKSLVRKTPGFRRKPVDNQISEEVARKIQKNSYDQSHTKIKDTFTPPYKLIEEQLEVEDDQIYRAAVFNMANIGANCKKYASDIISSLEKSLEKEFRTTEQKDYVRERVEFIKNSKH